MLVFLAVSVSSSAWALGEREVLEGWGAEQVAIRRAAGECGVSIDARLARAAQFNWLRLSVSNASQELVELGMEDTIADFEPGRRRALSVRDSESLHLLMPQGASVAVWLAFPHKRDFKYAERVRISVPLRIGSRVCTVTLPFQRLSAEQGAVASTQRYVTSELRLGGGTGVASIGSWGHLGRAQQSVNLAWAVYLMPRHGFFVDGLIEAYERFGHDSGRDSRLLTLAGGYTYDWYLGGGVSTGYRAGVGASRLELLDGRRGPTARWAPSVSERITLDYTWSPGPHAGTGRYGLGLVLAHDFRAGGRWEGSRLRGHTLSLLLSLVFSGT